MMLRRRLPNATGISRNCPSSSGPRWMSAESILFNKTRSSFGCREPYQPAMPHIMLSLESVQGSLAPRNSDSKLPHDHGSRNARAEYCPFKIECGLNLLLL